MMRIIHKVVLTFCLAIIFSYPAASYKDQIRQHKSNVVEIKAIRYSSCLIFLFKNLRERQKQLNNV